MRLALAAVIFTAAACGESATAGRKSVSGTVAFIELPEGFKAEMYMAGVENARAMALDRNGTLYVGSRRAGKVYAIPDADGDLKGDTVIEIAKGLQMPVGLAMKDGDLYVSATSRIYKLPGVSDKLLNAPEAVLVSDAFPEETHHGWKFIDFGPDGKLYVPVGAPCNICHEDEQQFANIMRMNADGSGLETFAMGVRNTVGFDWHPDTEEMWFTDNGRDWLGDDEPPCEFNHAPRAGMHFGYPFCHGGFVSDPEFGDKRDCDEFEKPAVNFDAHTAPLGMCFYTGTQFPENYHKEAFVAQHGSWNRTTKIGYQVVVVNFDQSGNATGYTPFATGFEQKGKVNGRPVDVLQLGDGSLLISDDHADCIYRIHHEP